MLIIYIFNHMVQVLSVAPVLIRLNNNKIGIPTLQINF